MKVFVLFVAYYIKTQNLFMLEARVDRDLGQCRRLQSALINMKSSSIINVSVSF